MFSYLRISILIFIISIAIACKKNNSIPTSLSVSPTIDTIGGTVTITGSGFSSTATDNIVLFNDSSAGIVLTASSTQLTVLVPGYVTEGRITVKNKTMESQTAQVFQIAPKFFPQAEAPSYPVSIMTGGSPNLSDYSVSFNGTVASPTKIYNDVLTVPVPNGATSGKIVVNFKGKPYTSLTDFTVTQVGTVSSVTSQGIFSLPTGLAVDQNGNLFVADLEAGLIDIVNPTDGSITTYAGSGPFTSNGGSPLIGANIYGALNLAFAPNGILYATDQWYGPIWKITADSATSLFSPAQFYSTLALYIDATGNLYISAAQKIEKITPDGAITTLAGQPTQGFQDGPISVASFVNPSSLVLDGTGNIFIADNNVIRLLSNGYVSTFVGGGGNGDYTDGTGLHAGFIGINSIAIDPTTGNIFATDPGDHVVRMITPAGVVTTIAGHPGQQGNQNGIGSAALFQGPSGIALDKNGNIYVSDGSYANSSIRKIVLH